MLSFLEFWYTERHMSLGIITDLRYIIAVQSICHRLIVVYYRNNIMAYTASSCIYTVFIRQRSIQQRSFINLIA